MKSKIQKFLRALFITLAILITIIALLIVFENWSGARKWKEVHSMLVNEGLELDPKRLFPKVPPSEENFAALPLISALSDFHETEEDLIYADQETVDRFRSMSLPDRLKNSDFMPNYATVSEVNLTAISEGLQKDGFSPPSKDSSPAQIIQSWMSQFEMELAELDQAAQRPLAVLEFEIAEDFLSQFSTSLPFTSDFRNHQLFQAARACAALENGDEKEAMAALVTMVQISRTEGSSPILINLLIRLADHNLTLSVVWQGMISGSWSVDSLRQIEDLIAGESEGIFENMEKAINLEMLMTQVGACDFLKNPSREGIAMMNSTVTDADGSGFYPGAMIIQIIPDGVYDHNKSFGCQFMFDHFLMPVRNRKFHSGVNNYKDAVKKRNPRNFISTMTVPAIENVLVNCFHAVTMNELARAAVAVELAKAETGQLPEDYSAIISRFPGKPPVDITSESGNADFRYRHEGDSYLLYAQGYNQVDDNGTVILRPNSNKPEKKEGDWVWKYE